MGVAFLLCHCINCGTQMMCNPLTVPSIRVNEQGPRQPLCRACADEWNRIHRTEKGLPIVPIKPDAYEPCNEADLG